MKGKRTMKHMIQKCLHWLASDARQTIAEVKYAFRRRSKRVLLAVQMAALVVILVESVIMSICTDFSWLVAILVFQYCILIIIDFKHLLSIVQCITEWGLAVVFTIMVFVRQMAL